MRTKPAVGPPGHASATDPAKQNDDVCDKAAGQTSPPPAQPPGTRVIINSTPDCLKIGIPSAGTAETLVFAAIFCAIFAGGLVGIVYAARHRHLPVQLLLPIVLPIVLCLLAIVWVAWAVLVRGLLWERLEIDRESFRLVWSIKKQKKRAQDLRAYFEEIPGDVLWLFGGKGHSGNTVQLKGARLNSVMDEHATEIHRAELMHGDEAIRFGHRFPRALTPEECAWVVAEINAWLAKARAGGGAYGANASSKGTLEACLQL